MRRGFCPICSREVAVMKGGEAARHGFGRIVATTTFTGQPTGRSSREYKSPCRGSGERVKIMI